MTEQAKQGKETTAQLGADGVARAVTPYPALTLTRKQALTVMRALEARDLPDHACRLCVGDTAFDSDFICVKHVIQHWLDHSPKEVEEAPPPAAIPPDVADALTAANDWLQSHGEQRHLTTHAVVTKLRDALASIVRAPAG